MKTGDVVADRYELVELVGTGGMSSVYKARDTLLERHVALKVLHQHHAEDAEYVERFRREARTVAQLSHPNIVTVIDRGETTAGRPFIVFEFVAGQTLDGLLARRGPLPIEEALQLAISVARGLAFAHKHGLVHRDVKPHNILLNGDGRPKVTDFGIARSLDVKKGVTQTGTVLGTSNYISPEQASGERVTAQSDVYSFGVVLFELLTGKVPFEGESFVSVALRHINEPAPDVRSLRRDVPPHVAAAVARALEKDPAARFPTMEAFARELEACLREARASAPDAQPTMLRPPAPAASREEGRPPRRRRRVSAAPVLLALLALGALAVIVVAAVAVRNRDSGPPGSTSTSETSGSTGVRLTATAAYDPQGDKTEHDAEVANATDGNAGTYWTTEDYGNETFGELKTGVGLELDAPAGTELQTLTVTTDTPGFTALVRAGSSTGAARAVSSPKVVGGKTTFDLDGADGPVFVLWITRLAPDGVAHVNEVKATG